MDNIENIVKNVIGNIVDQKHDDYNKLDRIWMSILEENELKHTKMVGIKNGSILVNVDSPAWLYQMNTRKRRILKQLQEEIPSIVSIKFKTGSIK